MTAPAAQPDGAAEGPAPRCDRCGRFTKHYRIINVGRPDDPDELLLCRACDGSR